MRRRGAGDKPPAGAAGRAMVRKVGRAALAFFSFNQAHNQE